MRSSDLFALVATSLGLFACTPPHRDVPAKDVPALGKLEATSFSDADFTTLADVSERIQATSARTKAFSRGPGFDALADRLGGTAKQLGEAAGQKDAKAATAALSAMKATCKECHTKFR